MNYKHNLGNVMTALQLTPLDIELLIALNDNLKYRHASQVWDYMIDDESYAYLETYAAAKQHAETQVPTWHNYKPVKKDKVELHVLSPEMIDIMLDPPICPSCNENPIMIVVGSTLELCTSCARAHGYNV